MVSKSPVDWGCCTKIFRNAALEHASATWTRREYLALLEGWRAVCRLVFLGESWHFDASWQFYSFFWTFDRSCFLLSLLIGMRLWSFGAVIGKLYCRRSETTYSKSTHTHTWTDLHADLYAETPSWYSATCWMYAEYCRIHTCWYHIFVWRVYTFLEYASTQTSKISSLATPKRRGNWARAGMFVIFRHCDFCRFWDIGRLDSLANFATRILHNAAVTFSEVIWSVPCWRVAELHIV